MTEIETIREDANLNSFKLMFDRQSFKTKFLNSVGNDSSVRERTQSVSQDILEDIRSNYPHRALSKDNIDDDKLLDKSIRQYKKHNPEYRRESSKSMSSKSIANGLNIQDKDNFRTKSLKEDLLR